MSLFAPPQGVTCQENVSLSQFKCVATNTAKGILVHFSCVTGVGWQFISFCRVITGPLLDSRAVLL